MKNSAIIFISDIHYSRKEGISQFQIDDKNDYYHNWVNFLIDIKNKLKIIYKYVIIAGDITEKASKKEFEDITSILNSFCDDLNIDKKNILIIPGNHDINRAKLVNYCDENGIDEKDAYKLIDIKLENYSEFYKKFMGENEYEIKKSIISSIYVDEINTYILGINSLEKESHLDEQHLGYIDTDNLINELKDYNDKNIFIVAHHSFTDTGDREIATIENFRTIKESLKLRGINTYIYGHHHTSESKLDIEGDDGQVYRYLEIGSIGKILQNYNGESYTNRFSIAICESGELYLHDFAYIAGYWEEINNDKYLHKLKISESLNIESQNIEIINKSDFYMAFPIIENTENAIVESNNETLKKNNSVIIYEKSEFMYKYLKRDENYKEGHFHWKDKNKTLGWINIAAFLGDIDILNKIKESIIDMYEIYMKDTQVVIGYGMEGNIFGSILLSYWIDNNVRYYFYPSVHKEKEHINVEKTLWNEYGDYDNILILFDIMPDNEYLMEIFDSNNNLRKCKKAYVVSLFCNENLLKNDKEVGGNMIVERFALAKFNVSICDKNENECLICQKNISKVYYL